VITQPYYADISKYPLLDSAEEKHLAACALLEDGSKSADKLITANLRFVISVAKQYVGQGLALEDLISEGNYGLIKAVKKYDPTRNYKFITYANYWIRQAILQAISEHNRIIRIPANKVALLTRISRATDKLTAEYEREPTMEEIQEYLGETFDHDVIGEIQLRPIDVDEQDDEGHTISDSLVAPEDTSLKRDMFYEELTYLLGKGFSEREQEILMMYFGLDDQLKMTLEQLGYTHGISRERIRQIKNNAIAKLKTHPEIDRLRDFL